VVYAVLVDESGVAHAHRYNMIRFPLNLEVFRDSAMSYYTACLGGESHPLPMRHTDDPGVEPTCLACVSLTADMRRDIEGDDR
jgi:hypothetical protein